MSQLNISYRLGRLSDWKQIKHVNSQSLPENYPSDEWKQILKKSKHPHKHFVAVDTKSKHIIGYLVTQYNSSTQFIYIYSFAVLEAYRKKGVGSKLWENLMNDIQTYNSINDKIKGIQLHVRRKNINAFKFYIKRQLKFKSVKHNAYEYPTDDAFLMECEI